jgi:ubiquinol oxidase
VPGPWKTRDEQAAGIYWDRSDEATLLDVILVARADEAHHRDVNHGYANELAGLPVSRAVPCPPHFELQPTWKQVA